MKQLIALLGLASALAAIWFGGPLTGVLLLGTEWARFALMGSVLLLFGLGWLIGRLRRRSAARAIERALMRDGSSDDSKVLADRMTDALSHLKKTQGGSYLYDLPWYVIIGPPGAGKTTALVNSGLRFPVAGAANVGLEGFGGTRYCDWWFADEAVLIDTAGRYTTQDSDAVSDGASWLSFLSLLKRSRPKQPINGVILAFSVEDIMRSTPEMRARHAETVRARLGEMQQTLRVDLPVYVLFTKADLITGFREFFGDFNQEKREEVWGVTFPTKDRKARVSEHVGAEFDRLVAHLGSGLIDRMTAESDDAARIAMFQLPGQLAHLRGPVVEFLEAVFAPGTQRARTALRGFYFASGTQEGTPFDQALGALQRIGDGGSGAGMAFSPGFMSGKGKSFFLHDLLKTVIFEERNWVGYSRRAVLRSAILRSLALTVIMVVTAGALGALGYTYWQNASLMAQTRAQVQAYQAASVQQTGQTLVSDPDLRPVLPLLNDMRALAMQAAPDLTLETPWGEVGLGQRERIAAAAQRAYSDALEQMLRPRLVLALENSFPFWDKDMALAETFEGLKIYMLLGGQGPRPDDAAIRAFFDHAWSVEFGAGSDAHQALNDHLAAMLDLDDSRALLVGIRAETVSLARAALSRATLAELGYALVRDDPEVDSLPPWDPVAETGGGLMWRGAAGLTAVPGVFTAQGFQRHVVPELNAVGDRIRADQWVLGLSETGAPLQVVTLPARVQELYAAEFVTVWEQVLDGVVLAPVTMDAPAYAALARLARPATSALLALITGVAEQTTLLRPLPVVEEAFAPWTGSLAGGVGTRPIDEVLGHLERSYAVLTTTRDNPGAVAAALDPLNSLRKLLPATAERLVGSAQAEIRRHAIPPDLERMRLALAEEVGPVCTDRIAAVFPFAPSDQSVSLEDFTAIFGPGGTMERYFETYLRPHVTLGAPRLLPHPDSPLKDVLSPDLLAQFDRASRIRDAFFPSGRSPRVDLVVRHVDSSEDVASARLVVNDMLIETVKGDVPVLVQWPGAASGARLDLLPATAGQTSELAFAGSPWDVMRLLQSARSRAVQGDLIRVTFVLGGRQITYEMRSRTAPNPFALRDLMQFDCPTGLE